MRDVEINIDAVLNERTRQGQDEQAVIQKWGWPARRLLIHREGGMSKEEALADCEADFRHGMDASNEEVKDFLADCARIY